MSFRNQFLVFECEHHQMLVSKSYDSETADPTIKFSVNSEHGEIEVSLGGYVSEEKRDEMFDTKINQELVNKMYNAILQLIGEQDEEDDEYRNEKD